MNILMHYFCGHMHSFLLCKYLNEIAGSRERTLEVILLGYTKDFCHLKICIKQLQLSSNTICVDV